MNTFNLDSVSSLFSDDASAFDIQPSISFHAGQSVLFPGHSERDMDNFESDVLGHGSTTLSGTIYTGQEQHNVQTDVATTVRRYEQTSVSTAPGPRSGVFSSAAVQALLGKIRQLEASQQVVWFSRMKQQLDSLWNAAYVHSADQQVFRRAHCVGGFTSSKGVAVALHVQVLVTFLTEKQTCWACILHREKCLKALRWQLQDFAHGQRCFAKAATNRARQVIGVDQEWEIIRRGFRARIRTLLLSLLKLTVQFIEHLQSWRSALWRPRPFIFRGSNYAKKIAFDTQWLTRENVHQLLREINVPKDEVLICTTFSSPQAWATSPPTQNDWMLTLGSATAASHLPASIAVLERIAAALSCLGLERNVQRNYRKEQDSLKRRKMYLPMMRWRLEEPGNEDTKSRLFRRQVQVEKAARRRLQAIRKQREAARVSLAAQGSFGRSAGISQGAHSVEQWEPMRGDDRQNQDDAAIDEYGYYDEAPGQTARVGGSDWAADFPPALPAAKEEQWTQDHQEEHWAGDQYVYRGEAASALQPDKEPSTIDTGMIGADGWADAEVEQEARPAELPETTGRNAPPSDDSDSDNDDAVPGHVLRKDAARAARAAPLAPAPPEARAHRRVLSSDNLQSPQGPEHEQEGHQLLQGAQSAAPQNEFGFEEAEYREVGEGGVPPEEDVEQGANEVQYDEWGGYYDEWGGYTDADGVYYDPSTQQGGGIAGPMDASVYDMEAAQGYDTQPLRRDDDQGLDYTGQAESGDHGGAYEEGGDHGGAFEEGGDHGGAYEEGGDQGGWYE